MVRNLQPHPKPQLTRMHLGSITSRQEPRCSAQPNRMLMHLEDGEMDGPWGATPNEILQIVTKCFAIRPVARPRFEEIVRILNEFEGVEHI